MTRWMLGAGLALALFASCDSDDTQEGARAQCAEGGELNACPASVADPMDACWRLVDCAAIPLRSSDDNVFDWGNCVDYLGKLTDDRQTLVEQCLAASTCDTLKVDGSPDKPNAGQLPCLQIGDQ